MADIDADLRLLEWWQGIRETNNETFLPLFFNQSRFLVLCGGGGSGKSVFAARKVIERCNSEPGHRWLVCRKVGRTLRDSCFALLRGLIAEHYAETDIRVFTGDMRIKFPNKSEILFAGLDDVEKLKSIYDITGIWVEEASEIDEADFQQLDIRLRTVFPYYKQMIISFNPISVSHWLKKRFFDQQDPRATTHRSTYKDNRFLDPDGIRTLEAFRDTDTYHYQVYALGEWGVTGKTIFNALALSERLKALTEPVKRGFWEYTIPDGKLTPEDIRWTEDENGPVCIYIDREKGHPYVIGGDTAGDGSDWFVGQVLDNSTGKQVAVLHCQYDEDTYARQMYCLGKYFNDALICVETNFSTYPVKLLDMMGYQNLYVREREDSFTGSIVMSFGFRTTAVTRPIIIADLVRILRDGAELLNDRTTIEELLTFVRNEKLRPEAEAGTHDDTVMALAIAYYARSQQTTAVLAVETTAETKWTEDMWQDYLSADKTSQKWMIQAWGRPRR